MSSGCFSKLRGLALHVLIVKPVNLSPDVVADTHTRDLAMVLHGLPRSMHLRFAQTISTGTDKPDTVGNVHGQLLGMPSVTSAE